MARTLEIDEFAHLFPLLLCSSLAEVLIGGKKGSGQLVKREQEEKGEARIIFRTENEPKSSNQMACWEKSGFVL